MKFILFALTLMIGWSSAHASRILEIEDYFSERSSDFIKRRYPNRPYTVFVRVEVPDEIPKRNKKLSSTQLPYLDVVEGDTDFWSRKDVPLTTLITYLEQVTVRIEIDASMTSNEISDFQDQLFEYLKLSTGNDKVEVKKMDWISNSEALERRMWMGGAIALPLILMLLLFGFTRLSIRSLVKGLSEPISEIGKSTQNFAANALTLATGKMDHGPREISHAATGAVMSGDSSYELRRAFKEQLAEHAPLFANPNPELIEFLEREGQNSPAIVGSLLCELNRDVLKNIFQFGYGDWWFKALSSPTALSTETLQMVYRLNFLKMRQQFSAALRKPSDAQVKDLGLILNRLNYVQLEAIAKEYPLKKILPVFALLPKEKCMRACKQAYPGEWGTLINNADWGTPDGAVAKAVQQKALAANPLRHEQAVENFFVNMDYQRYLDGAHTKDEKEFYRALPESSPLKKERTPFYEIFENGGEILKELAANVALNDWALAMKDCDRVDSIKVFDLLSERQRYFLRNMITSIKASPQMMEDKILAKKRIMAIYQEKKAFIEIKNQPQNDKFKEVA